MVRERLVAVPPDTEIRNPDIGFFTVHGLHAFKEQGLLTLVKIFKSDRCQ